MEKVKRMKKQEEKKANRQKNETNTLNKPNNVIKYLPLDFQDIDELRLMMLDDVLKLNNEYNAYVGFENMEKYYEIIEACYESEANNGEYLRFRCIFKNCTYMSSLCRRIKSGPFSTSFKHNMYDIKKHMHIYYEKLGKPNYQIFYVSSLKSRFCR